MSDIEQAGNPVNFRWIVDQTPVSVMITDRNGNIEYVNRRCIDTTGYSESELLGRNPRLLQSGEHDSAFYQNMWQTVLQGGVWEGTLSNRSKDGSVLVERASMRPIADARGLVSHVVAIKQLVSEDGSATERLHRQGARLAEALERSNEAGRARREFLSKMSHELRTPVTGISGLLEILLDEEGDTAQRGRLRILKETSDHLKAVVNQILDIASMEEAPPELLPADLALDSFLQKLLARYANQAQSESVELSLRIDPAVPQRIRTDGEKLRQILDHLLDNALKFGRSGSIAVSVMVPSTASPYVLEFAVADSGPGVAPPDRERIFEPFCQLDSSYSREHRGPGLGLSLSRLLAQVLGGTIWVVDTPGGGATFCFTVEAEAPGNPKVAESDWWQGNSYETMPKTVLLVEDNRINRLVLRHILEQGGIEVSTVDNGRDALAAMQEQLYDAVLLDIEMTDIRGSEIIEALRSFEANTGRSQQRIVALTAHGVSAERQRIIDAGVDGFVTKPVKSEELLESIRVALHPQSARSAS